ncbi:monosaccharide-transporting ATPase [Spirochaetia bacterium]|nr:monosaccharide-transporting ATPase [Spirochaetia bacterium]
MLLEIKNVSKQYPGVKALDNVSFSMRKGEVMALLGENGAGKSTLVKILSGAINRDDGEIILDGKKFPARFNPIDARKLGVAIIYQELSLLPQLSVAENIFLTREPVVSKWWIDYRRMNQLAREQLKKLRADYIDVTAKVETLPLPEQQMVEIAKALAVDCKLIIMDEPTTSLTWEETDRLFDVIHHLRSQNITIIYISHRMDEIFKIAQSAAVLRDGKFVGKVIVENSSTDEIVEMMTGKILAYNERPKDLLTADYTNKDAILFSAKNLGDNKTIKNISFNLYRNEVLGFAGLVGAKRTEIARMIFGADKLPRGELRKNGRVISVKSPFQSIQNGIGYLSENRKEEGLNLGVTIKENVVLTDMKKVSSFSFINPKKVDAVYAQYQESINIKGVPNTLVSSLSGGNQQKVAIAKWLHSGCDILIFDEPTRGIDVAAKAEIYKLVRRFAKENGAAIVISSDAAELVNVCDRVLILSRGEIVEEILPNGISPETILKGIVSNKKGGEHAQDEC